MQSEQVTRPGPLPETFGAGSSPGADAASAAGPPSFSEILQQRLASSRQGVDGVREAIAAIRSGAVLRSAGAGSARPAAGQSAPGAWADRQAVGGVDPFGWRARAYQLGEQVVGPGFGAIFERQIGQESGYDPAVAFGLRRSSAGAEGIAQLMPQYYPGVDRTDPEQSLQAGARTMRHYLLATDGDVRQSLAAYNAGLGRVRSLVQAHGDQWERALPEETKQYLAGILGDATPTATVGPAGRVHASALPELTAADLTAVFGGVGPGGVMTMPLDRMLGQWRSGVDPTLQLPGLAGTTVRAPADGYVLGITAGPPVGGGSSVLLDHGRGWVSTLSGLADLAVGTGERVGRSDPLGALASALIGSTGGSTGGTLGGGGGDGRGVLGFSLTLDGRPLDPRRYLLPG